MTEEQRNRWEDFSLRMARKVYRIARRPDCKWIVSQVESWFDCLDDSWFPTIVDWDNSTEYPKGNRYHGREYNSSYCGCKGWRHEHGSPNPQCDECHGSGLHHALYHGDLVCDSMSMFMDDDMGYPPDCRACNEYDSNAKCRCEEIQERFYEQWQKQWAGPVNCCIRAGLDMSTAPSAGVVGFTAGDVRLMYPEGVPDWVFPPGERLHYWLSDEVNGTFAELPDDAGVVL